MATPMHKLLCDAMQLIQQQGQQLAAMQAHNARQLPSPETVRLMRECRINRNEAEAYIEIKDRNDWHR